MNDRTGSRRLPGDPSPEQMIGRIIRVDQAGEALRQQRPVRRLK